MNFRIPINQPGWLMESLRGPGVFGPRKCFQVKPRQEHFQDIHHKDGQEQPVDQASRNEPFWGWSGWDEEMVPPKFFTASLYTLKMVVKEDVCRLSFQVNVCFWSLFKGAEAVKLHGGSIRGVKLLKFRVSFFHMWWINPCVRFPKRKFCFRILELLQKIAQKFAEIRMLVKSCDFFKLGHLKMHGHAAVCAPDKSILSAIWSQTSTGRFDSFVIMLLETKSRCVDVHENEVFTWWQESKHYVTMWARWFWFHIFVPCSPLKKMIRFDENNILDLDFSITN